MDAIDGEMIPPKPPPVGAGSANVLGGFSHAGSLLEFDQIRRHLASFTRTVVGQESAWSLAPSRQPLEIATRQQETDEARQFLDQGESLEFGLDTDLRPLVQRALLDGLLRGEDLHAILELVRASRYSRSSLTRRQELPLLAGIARNIPDLEVLEEAIRSAISPAGEILDDASPALRDLRREGRAAYQRLNEVMQRNLRRLQRQGLVQEPIITQRNGRAVLLVKAEMKSQAPGIVHDVSDSGATVFIEPMAAIELGNRWRETRLAEEREEERILRDLSSLVGQLGEDLQLTLDLLGRLDLAMAKGRCSITWRATAPLVTQQEGAERYLRLTQARHPLLPKDAVPISLELGRARSTLNTLEGPECSPSDHQGSNRPYSSYGTQPKGASSPREEQPGRTVMLITGPNAGGKTVALKTVGLLALMAHAGLHVPAEEAHFPLLDGVFADIGDQQSIEQSLSTFSSHIQNLRTIMEQATARSLVLVDELGTSTEPEEGSALAQAILSYFQRSGVLMVATTHHRAVAHYVQEQPGMVNASVDLDPQTLDPTYRVTMGLPVRSYAMTIAARMGLAPNIIEHAKSLMSPSQAATDDLVQELRAERQLVEQLHQDAEIALAQARVQQTEVEVRLASVEATKTDLVEEARQELQDQIEDLLSRLRRVERSLQQHQEFAAVRPAAAPVPEPEAEEGYIGDAGSPQREPIAQLRSELIEAHRQVTSVQWQPIQVNRVNWQHRLRGGDRVYIRGIGRPVEVLSPPDKEDRVEVLLGTMRAKIPVYQLEGPAAENPQASVPPKRGGSVGVGSGIYLSRGTGGPPTGSGRRLVSTEIDLRGHRADEALFKIDSLLNDASLSGAGQLKIIHGRGTGALRRAVREYLGEHPLVATFAPAADASGEGVTVVELK